MNWLARIWAWLLSWLRWPGSPQRKAPPYRTVVVQEALPTMLDPATLYIVEDDGYQEQAAMVCPCGCGSTLNMNLLPDERPCWKVTCHPDGSASLHPSVWRQKGCRAHFWFKEGRVLWCD